MNAFQQHHKHCNNCHVSLFTAQENKDVKILHAILLHKHKSNLMFLHLEHSNYSLNSFFPPCLT